MNFCNNCQHKNPPQANFCNQCGTALLGLKTKVKSTKKKSAERRQLTILFCDLVGSTTLSEHMDPEDYRQIILNYHKTAEIVIDRFGGYVGNYLGDGLLVYFGYPKGIEDAARVGIQAGLGILKSVESANKQWVKEGLESIEIRIGVHTGLVVVDEHLALGETVNTASRLEGMAPPNGIVVSPQTLNLASGWFEVKSLGEKQLKGISEPMEVFQILNESGAKTRLDIAKGLGLSPLVGREKELVQITKLWNQAKNGQGNMLLLNGEAGIGKSRLVDTIEETFTAESTETLLETRCSPHQVNSSFYPIIKLIQNDFLHFESDDSNKKKIVKLTEFLRESGADLDVDLPLFIEYLSLSSDAFPPLNISPFAKRQKFMKGISKALLFHALDHPVLFVIEDLHWIDASTLEWLKMVKERISNKSIFILCTTRPNFNLDWKNSDTLTQINLQRLSSQNMLDICMHQTKGKKLPQEILSQIATKTEGVPLFIEELTKMLIDSESLIEQNNTYDLVGPISSILIPSTLQDSLLARLDQLYEVKEIVQIGSILGREFSKEMLDVVFPTHIENKELALKKILEAEIFHTINRGQEIFYRFKHALIQDAAYESLLKRNRQLIHSKIATVLEQQFNEICQIQPELYAHHLTEGGQTEKAISIWLKAGQLASQKNASKEAIAHLEKGIELLPFIKDIQNRNILELDFRLTLGGSFVIAYGFPHPLVKETFKRATNIAQTMEVSPKLALIQFNLLSYYFNTEDYKSGDELVKYMQSLATNPTHGYWFDLLSTHLGTGTEIIRGRFKKAELGYQKVLELFDPTLPFPWELTPSGYLEITALSWRMLGLQILGEMDHAKLLADAHLNYIEAHQDSMTLYHIYTFPALYKLEIKEWTSAVKILEEYLPIARDFGDPIFVLTAEVYYNVAKAFQGDNKAFETAIKLINTCFDIGFKAFAVTLSPYIGEKYLQNKKFDSALNWIEKILDHVDQTGTHIKTSELFRIKALVLKGLKKPDKEVIKYLMMSLNLAKKQEARTYELRTSIHLALLWHQQGKVQDSINLLSRLIDSFTVICHSNDLTKAKNILQQLREQNIS